jgi:hypothetical protein
MRDCDDSGTRAARVRGFRLYYEGETFLRVQDLWPDGDAPENPTVADVRALMRAEGPHWKVIREWDLDHDVVISVDRVLGEQATDD